MSKGTVKWFKWFYYARRWW